MSKSNLTKKLEAAKLFARNNISELVRDYRALQASGNRPDGTAYDKLIALCNGFDTNAMGIANTIRIDAAMQYIQELEAGNHSMETTRKKDARDIHVFGPFYWHPVKLWYIHKNFSNAPKDTLGYINSCIMPGLLGTTNNDLHEKFVVRAQQYTDDGYGSHVNLEYKVSNKWICVATSRGRGCGTLVVVPETPA